jgi:hypothetical protein
MTADPLPLPFTSTSMERVHQQSLSVLERHPAPALPEDEIRSLLRLEGVLAPEGPGLKQALAGQGNLFRVLTPKRRSRWIAARPRSWILARPRHTSRTPRALGHRMRETLRHLGEGISDHSHRALLRWERRLLEAAQANEMLERLRVRR